MIFNTCITLYVWISYALHGGSPCKESVNVYTQSIRVELTGYFPFDSCPTCRNDGSSCSQDTRAGSIQSMRSSAFGHAFNYKGKVGPTYSSIEEEGSRARTLLKVASGNEKQRCTYVRRNNDMDAEESHQCMHPTSASRCSIVQSFRFNRQPCHDDPQQCCSDFGSRRSTIWGGPCDRINGALDCNNCMSFISAVHLIKFVTVRWRRRLWFYHRKNMLRTSSDAIFCVRELGRLEAS